MQFETYCVFADMTMAEGMKRLNVTSTQILIVVSSAFRLLGTVTDGDIRRAILRRLPETAPLIEIMNSHPLAATADWSQPHAQAVMRANSIHHIPVIDEESKLIGVFTEESLVSRRELPNTAVLMAGGMGKRLGEMTRNCPKPMLQIGGRPILETTISVLRDAGIRNFVLAVNYLAEQIEDYFGSGREHGVTIDYLVETEPLGTAGALRFLENAFTDPILVMNADILTRANFGHLIKYHTDNNAVATMCVRDFSHQLPFGVVELDGPSILKVREKPVSSFFVNTGIYVLDPLALHFIPKVGPFDMPGLFNILQEQHKHVIAYPISEYWSDIGQPSDFALASATYSDMFHENATL